MSKTTKHLRERRQELGRQHARHITAAADCRRQQKAIDAALKEAEDERSD